LSRASCDIALLKGDDVPVARYEGNADFGFGAGEGGSMVSRRYGSAQTAKDFVNSVILPIKMFISDV
jgi:hypothetical protein